MQEIDILIVENDPATAAMLEYMARVLCLQSVTVTDITGAAKAIAEHQPQIAILNLTLPYEESIELLSQIRESELPIAVGVLSAACDRATLQQCDAWQPDAFFSMPFDAYIVGEWLEYQKARLHWSEPECLLC